MILGSILCTRLQFFFSMSSSYVTHPFSSAQMTIQCIYFFHLRPVLAIHVLLPLHVRSEWWDSICTNLIQDGGGCVTMCWYISLGIFHWKTQLEYNTSLRYMVIYSMFSVFCMFYVIWLCFLRNVCGHEYVYIHRAKKRLSSIPGYQHMLATSNNVLFPGHNHLTC